MTPEILAAMKDKMAGGGLLELHEARALIADVERLQGQHDALQARVAELEGFAEKCIFGSPCFGCEHYHDCQSPCELLRKESPNG